VSGKLSRRNQFRIEQENDVGPEVIATLRPIHHQLANTGVLYMFVCGVWGLYMTARKQPMNANYRGMLAIGYSLGVLIGLLGMVMLISGAQPRDPLHILYGVVLAVALPGAAAYFNERPNERKPLIYALTSFFIMGIMIRGITTGA
jgi:hypothetical protein